MLFDYDNLDRPLSEIRIPLPSLVERKYQITEEEYSATAWVGSLIICCKPNCEVKASILALSFDVLSCLYQCSDFTFKSPKTTIRNGLWLGTSSSANSRILANWSNILVGWLGDRYISGAMI